jgi:CRISPR-associated protein Csx17
VNEPLSLDGCSPEPLMAYLKALGVLRLVSEQKDAEARGFWDAGVFKLSTSLDREALVAFFHDEYRPTPIVAPWGGGSGFFGNDNRVAVDAIASSSSLRVTEFAAAIRAVRATLERLRITTKPADALKEELLREYRRTLPDRFVEWMDSALVVQASGQAFAPLLGTGGNDGRLDFTQNFMQRLTDLGLATGQLVPEADRLLRQALFALPTTGLLSAAVGQFDPGKAGGPNATTGLEGISLVNPWDFVLMLEGTLLLSGAVSRRMGVAHRDRAVFPFTVRAVSAGYGSGADTEEDESRGEIWLPLWAAPTTARELRLAFAEGRAEYNGRQSASGLDFARAVVSLGVDRGFTAFTRYGFLKRSGKAFVASALGSFPVREKRAADLLRELDSWLERFRRACAKDEVPGRFRVVRRRVEEAMLNLCRYANSDDTTDWLQALLAALGAAERELSVGGFAQKPVKGTTRPRVYPLFGLSGAWLPAADDGSPEFRLARGVAFLNAGTMGTGPIRRNLEPVEYNLKRRSWFWSDRCGHVVWGGRDLARNLGAVVVRRLMDSERNAEPILPFGSPFPVALSDVSAFLNGETDDEKLEDLLWGLSLIDRGQQWELSRSARHAELPRAYALTKLTLVPGRLRWQPAARGEVVLQLKRDGSDDPPSGVAVKPEPAIAARLRVGDVQGACDVAVRRLRASGFSPIGALHADGAHRHIHWASGGAAPERLLAALLFPIHDGAVNQLAGLVLRYPAAATLVEKE